MSVTAILAKRASALDGRAIDGAARTVAKQCLLDWIGVSLAARQDPLVKALVMLAQEDGGAGAATIIGRPERCSTSQAALVNGAMSHALDYDDVIVPMGHPTVPVAPVVLALAEQAGRSGRDVVTALIAGVEMECCVAALMGPSHYAHGWHSTSTFGTFGAAAAAGWLLGLDPEAMQMALGIAGTQAAGLKSMFGTMCKPLHAGKAAANGLLAARLAALGFTSNPDVLDVPQGFAATYSTTVDRAAALAEPPHGWHIRRAVFKFHAACYLTHSSIEGACRLRDRLGISPGLIEAVELEIDAGHLGSCAIAQPRTGLETKFSLKLVTAMALAGVDTADDASYTDELARRPDLRALGDRVSILPGPQPTQTSALTRIRLVDGSIHTEVVDVATPATDLEAQWNRLAAKFRGLAEPTVGRARAAEILALCRGLDELGDIGRLMALCRVGPAVKSPAQAAE